MPDLPRLLAIIGSGETSPTMGKLHRQLFDRLGPGPVPAAIVTTPFGFQENAEDVAAKTVGYFARTVGRDVEVADLADAAAVGTLAYETAIARLRGAAWVMSGPGSPSYALRHWRGTPVPDVLASKLRHGGCLVFASAAAVTLGRLALPVYEIYKVGEPPHWMEGLDLLAEVGLAVAVIPHYDNAEGGRHDTRYCYVGERRLQALESQLPPGTFVLGVDEHTACVLDVDAATATVTGNGAVWVRHQGRSERVGAGTTLPIAELAGLAAGDRRGEVAHSAPGAGPGRGATELDRPGAATPLVAETTRLRQVFDAAVAGRQGPGAAEAALELSRLVEAWSHDTFESDELDRAQALLRTMIVGLGEAAARGLRDPRERLAPFVEALLAVRRRAREERRWDEADAVRGALVEAGVEVRDTPGGVEWHLGPGN